MRRARAAAAVIGGAVVAAAAVGLTGVLTAPGDSRAFPVAAVGTETPLPADPATPTPTPSPSSSSSSTTPAGPAASATPTARPTTPRPTLAPSSRYLVPTNAIPKPAGCLPLTPGINGVKVKLVQRKLGFPASKWEAYDTATVSAVKAFQRRHGLAGDGIVGRATWKALGIKEDFCLDRWVAPVAVSRTATSAQRREAMIKFAKTYLGADYVWGGASAPRYGADCSGMVLQALYTAGLAVPPITLDKHVGEFYRTSKELYQHRRLRHYPRSQVTEGDLVFWTSNKTGEINHVAIYLGNGTVLEEAGTQGRYGKLSNRARQKMAPLVVRPFA